MPKKITINPITRLEGHGKIEIFLNDQGNVEDAFWQVAELQGFRTVLPGATGRGNDAHCPNICGVCPSAHHMAATKALDDLYGVEPTPTAKLIRQLEFNAFYIEDHYIHFFFLAAPDFVVGPDADPAERNILGVIGKVGKEIGAKVIEVRKRNREIIKIDLQQGAAPGRRAAGRGAPGHQPRSERMDQGDRGLFRRVCPVCHELFQRRGAWATRTYLDLILSDAYQPEDLLHVPGG